MKKRTLRSIAILLMTALVLTMMPLSVSAASKNPGKAKIKSVKVGKYKASTNSAKVTVKWKKAKKATGYIIYAKYGDEQWQKVKKVGRFVTTLRIKKASAGRLSLRVQAIRKVKGKTYKGKFSNVKTKFIYSKLTISQYVNKFEPGLKGRYYQGMEMSFSGNNVILTDSITDYSMDPYKIREAMGSEIYNELGTFQGEANKLRKQLQDGSGVTGIGVIVVWKLNGVELGRRAL